MHLHHLTLWGHDLWKPFSVFEYFRTDTFHLLLFFLHFFIWDFIRPFYFQQSSITPLFKCIYSEDWIFIHCPTFAWVIQNWRRNSFNILFFTCRMTFLCKSSLCFQSASFAMATLFLMSSSHLPSSIFCYRRPKILVLWDLFKICTISCDWTLYFAWLDTYIRFNGHLLDEPRALLPLCWLSNTGTKNNVWCCLFR